MEVRKKIVIITDDSASMRALGEAIAAIAGEYPHYTVAAIAADSFSGSDVLPAYAIFLGCETVQPPSFHYIETLWGHINLAGRLCGIFSSSAKAIKYLSALVRNSDIAPGKPFLAKDGTADPVRLRRWIHGILPADGGTK